MAIERDEPTHRARKPCENGFSGTPLGEEPPVRQHVDSGVGMQGNESIENPPEIGSEEKGLASGEADGTRRSPHMPGNVYRLVRKPGVIVACRRLGAHEAGAVAAVRKQDRVMDIRFPVQHQ